MEYRFAPIVRVSTERQETKGESLRTQREQIQATVKNLKGTIPDQCWKYSGQEHATPDQERTKLDQLLQDADKGIFDAVIVADASRWSRDNRKSKEGLEILKKHKIKFFVGSTEYDLFSPAQNMFLGLSAEIGEFQAMEQSRKSILNRIARAKRGIPSAGRLPFARTWSPEDGWGIDEEKHALIKTAVTRYLAGESIIDIAATYGMNASGLFRTLKFKCGDKWPVRFRKESLNIDEEVIIEIPRLLPEETIQAILTMGQANKTYNHGELKNRYLLSRMIFCPTCGRSLTGIPNHGGKRYYVHSKSKVLTKCSEYKHIPADLIENSVLLKLAQSLGNKDLIREAVEKATPDQERAEALRIELSTMQGRLDQVLKERSNLIDAIAKGLITDEDIREQRPKSTEAENKIRDRIRVIQGELSSIPGAEALNKLNKFTGKVAHPLSKDFPQWILKKSYDQQKKLLRSAFAGKDPKGHRYGVYVKFNEESGKFDFEIRGILGTELMTTPMDKFTIAELFSLDPHSENVNEEIKHIQETLTKNTMHWLGNISFTLSGVA